MQRRQQDQALRWRLRESTKDRLEVLDLPYTPNESNSGVVYVDSPMGNITLLLVSRHWSIDGVTGKDLESLARYIEGMKAE